MFLNDARAIRALFAPSSTLTADSRVEQLVVVSFVCSHLVCIQQCASVLTSNAPISILRLISDRIFFFLFLFFTILWFVCVAEFLYFPGLFVSFEFPSRIDCHFVVKWDGNGLNERKEVAGLWCNLQRNMGMIKRPALFFFFFQWGPGIVEKFRTSGKVAVVASANRSGDATAETESQPSFTFVAFFFFFVYAAVLNQMSNYVQREVIVMHLHECVGASSSIRLDDRHPTYPDKDI